MYTVPIRYTCVCQGRPTSLGLDRRYRQIYLTSEYINKIIKKIYTKLLYIG